MRITMAYFLVLNVFEAVHSQRRCVEVTIDIQSDIIG